MRIIQIEDRHCIVGWRDSWKIADRVIIMNNSLIVFDGSPDKALASDI